MTEMQEQQIQFTCINTGCKQLNTYILQLLAEDNPEGVENQVLRCKNCGTENVIKLTGFRFPLNSTVLRVGK